MINSLFRQLSVHFFLVFFLSTIYTNSYGIVHTLTNFSGDNPPHKPASDLSGFHKHGQTFLTWQNVPDTNTYYNVYRSSTPITTASDLELSEYLGYTNGNSAKDYNLSRHDQTEVYLVIDSGAQPLSANTGLFVTTALSNGNFYYAVTSMAKENENTTVVPGINSLENPIPEFVEDPYPVYQQSRIINELQVDIYTTFTSMKYAIDQPLMNKAGFIAMDFAVYNNVTTMGLFPLKMRFHPGGSDFLENIATPRDSEITISPEDYFPSGNNSTWWGANENFDIYNDLKNEVPPISGINYNFGQQRLTHILNWAIRNLPVDSNKIYLEGTSFGAIGAYFYAMTYPENIAAVKLNSGSFNLAFDHDYIPYCSLNEGMPNRETGNRRFGTVSSNLITNLGYRTYDLLNGEWLCHTFREKDFPVIYSVNGKNDTLIGWTEKPIYYDSVNSNYVGGYYFYDGRNHAGEGGSWGDNNFDYFRYKKNVSYPAFANCTANEDYGDGHATDGAPFGSINGFLDYKADPEEDATHWKTTLFLRDLILNTEELYKAPNSCNADITPRRLQQFNPAVGDALIWTVTHKGLVIQSGTFTYNGGLITIPQITVYRDSVQLEIARENTGTSMDFTNSNLILYPNPFFDALYIRCEMPVSGDCSLKIYDLQGRLVQVLMTGTYSQGIYQHTWIPENESNGLYLIQFETADATETKQAILIR
ncbi:MAG: T9SS type A sorting domain-containing protein [Chitinophagales bacterium]|nr:T9SS type A sorting domain-containing protein [Chitinophagales bacterium]